MVLLNDSELLRKLQRIAVEVYEHNYSEKELVLVGIFDTGYKLASLLVDEINQVWPGKIHLVKMRLNKKANQMPEVTLENAPSAWENLPIILVDDVLNTGRTLFYAVSYFAPFNIKNLQVAVMIDRSHRTFPVATDFVGYQLSTTLSDHIEITIQEPFLGSQAVLK